MLKTLTVSGAWTQRVVHGLERTGLDVRALCRHQGLDFERLIDPDTQVPSEHLEQLWSAARRRSADRDLGLHAGERSGPSITTPLSHLLLASRDLLDAVEHAVALQRAVTSQPALSLAEVRGGWAIVLASPPGEPATARHAVEFTMVVLAGFAAFLTPGEFRPLRVEFHHPFPGDASEHERLFRCPASFGQVANRLVVATETMRRPSPHYSAAMARQLEELATRAIQQLDDPSTTHRARALIRPRLHAGDVEIAAIASRLHLSRRTLQRRLEEEGTSFSSLVDETRRSLCLELVGAGEPLESVAGRAGFGSKRALLRAFKRWTGSTPSAYRAEHRSDAAKPGAGF